MLPTVQASRGTKRRKLLLAAFERLPGPEQEQLIAFAEFLAQRSAPEEPASSAEPAEMPRPAEESVIAAVRRLSRTYHMLDKGVMLHETAALVSAHLTQGRPAEEVIDELEDLVGTRYRDHLGKSGG